MKYEKPTKIISLITQLIDADVDKKQEIIYEIQKETMKTEFRHYPEKPTALLYKIMIWFGTKDYLHSNFSKETEEQLKEAIKTLEVSEVLIK